MASPQKGSWRQPAQGKRCLLYTSKSGNGLQKTLQTISIWRWLLFILFFYFSVVLVVIREKSPEIRGFPRQPARQRDRDVYKRQILERGNIVVITQGVDTVIHGDIADTVSWEKVLNQMPGLQICLLYTSSAFSRFNVLKFAFVLYKLSTDFSSCCVISFL